VGALHTMASALPVPEPARAGVGPDDPLALPALYPVVAITDGADGLIVTMHEAVVRLDAALVPLWRGVAERRRFRAGECTGWTEVPWVRIADALERLLAAGMLERR
jgi:hypothetical protein